MVHAVGFKADVVDHGILAVLFELVGARDLVDGGAGDAIAWAKSDCLLED
jgi:hypothetical protein